MARSNASADTRPVITWPSNITECRSSDALFTASSIAAMFFGCTTSLTYFWRTGISDHNSEAVPFSALRSVSSSWVRKPAGPLPQLDVRVQLAYAQPVGFEFFEARVDLLHENAVGKVSVEPIPHPHRRQIDGQVAV